jgi:hypothetical protein
VDTTGQPNKDNPVCLKEGCGRFHFKNTLA